MKRHTFESAKKYIESEGYTLLSDSYCNNTTPMNVICSNGHHIQKSLANILKGHECPVCAQTSRANNKLKYTIDDVISTISKCGYTLLSTSYRTKSTRLSIQCDVGHVYETTFAQFLIGRRCKVCAGNRPLTNEQVMKSLSDRDYEWVGGEYVSNKSRLVLKCRNGHIWETKYGNFQTGCDCPECQVHGTSKIEQRLYEYVKSLYSGVVINRDRSQILNPLTGRYLELDIWMPGLCKAIEFNGRHYHTDEKVLVRDEIKAQECINRGIDLLILDENEYIGRYNEVFKVVRQFIT